MLSCDYLKEIGLSCDYLNQYCHAEIVETFHKYHNLIMRFFPQFFWEISDDLIILMKLILMGCIIKRSFDHIIRH